MASNLNSKDSPPASSNANPGADGSPTCSGTSRAALVIGFVAPEWSFCKSPLA